MQSSGKKCYKCGKTFYSKYTLDTHLNKIKPCSVEYTCKECYEVFYDITLYNKHCKMSHKTFSCEYCSKKLSTKSSQKRHEKTCKKRTDVVLQTHEHSNNNKQFENDIINKMQEQMKEMQNKIDELSKTNNTCTINNVNCDQININHTQNNTQNIIHQHQHILEINNFGEENIDHIDLDRRLMHYKGLQAGFLNFIKDIFFDQDHPENMTFCIKDFNRKYANIKLNGRWETSKELYAVFKNAYCNSRKRYYNLILQDKHYLHENDTELLQKLEEFLSDLPSKPRKRGTELNKYYIKSNDFIEKEAMAIKDEMNDARRNDKKLLKDKEKKKQKKLENATEEIIEVE